MFFREVFAHIANDRANDKAHGNAQKEHAL